MLFIVGPTASGKTEAAIAVASELGKRHHAAEIVNADSRQVYRGMSIGTAKPTAEQIRVVPHHLLDIREPDDPFNLAMFLALARKTIEGIAARKAVPIVVGGTGQYVWGLVEGWEAPPVPPRRDFREGLETEAGVDGGHGLFERLRALDPAAASFIDPRNVRRVIRALEVIETTGKPFSEQRAKSDSHFNSKILGLDVPRVALYERIDRRVDAMIEAGWMDEVRALLAQGVSTDVPAFSSVGYQEIAAYVRGEIDLDEAKSKIRSATHKLARGQSNWFRRADTRIRWCQSESELVREAVLAVEA